MGLSRRVDDGGRWRIDDDDVDEDAFMVAHDWCVAGMLCDTRKALLRAAAGGLASKLSFSSKAGQSAIAPAKDWPKCIDKAKCFCISKKSRPAARM